MGQAKLRGTPEQRKQAAIEKQLSLRPRHIICNNCQTELTDIAAVDVAELPGIDAAFEAHCPRCGYDTYAIKGEKEAVARLHMAIEDAAGAEAQAGSVPSASGR